MLHLVCIAGGRGVAFRLREPLAPDVAARIEREREDCYRLHRGHILALHRERHGDTSRPWAWWAYESPEPRDKAMSEVDQLRRLGLVG